MSSEHPLMRPLRSDSLKPRLSAQASWTPKEPACPLGAADTPVCHVSAVSAETEVKEENSVQQPAEDSLSKAIAAILADPENTDEEDDETHLTPDAIPDHLIPEPACVPLFDSPASERKKRRWLWLALPLSAAGLLYAAWKAGYLALILP